MAPPLKIISTAWRIIEPTIIFLSAVEQFKLYFAPIAQTMYRVAQKECNDFDR